MTKRHVQSRQLEARPELEFHSVEQVRESLLGPMYVALYVGEQSKAHESEMAGNTQAEITRALQGEVHNNAMGTKNAAPNRG